MMFDEKKNSKKGHNLFGMAVGTAASAEILGSLGSAHGVEAMGRVSSFFPATGSLMGAGMVMKHAAMLNPKRNKNRMGLW